MPPRQGSRKTKRRKTSVVAAPPPPEPEIPQPPLSEENTEQENENEEGADNGNHSGAISAADVLMKEALELVLGGAKVSKEKAIKALETTAEHSKSGAADWAEEALCELAVDAECADEYEAMGQAMQISLNEAEERKSSEKPLKERSAEELCKLFSTSELLRSLQSVVGPDCVLQLMDTAGDLKQRFLDYLVMEQNCKKWYTCSMAYFSKTAAEMLPSLATAAHDKDAVDSPGRAQGNQEEAAGSSKAAPSDCKDEGWKSVLISFLNVELEKLEKEVFARPTDDGDTVPQMFTALAKEDTVELLE